MKRIIFVSIIFLSISLASYTEPKRENGLSVHFAPKSAMGVFGSDKSGFMVSQSKDLAALTQRPVLDTPEQLIEYFLKQPKEIQENGIWIVTTNPKAYSDEEMRSTENLKNLCREKNIKLFFCRGMFLPNGWLPADKFNLKDSDTIYSNMRTSKEIVNEAISYEKQGNYDKAIELYNEALKITGTPAYVIHDRGLAYMRKGESDKAIADFTKAMELNPDEIDFIAQSYNDRGNAYYDKGEYDKSWQDVQKAQSAGYKVHPDFLAALKSKGYSK